MTTRQDRIEAITEIANRAMLTRRGRLALDDGDNESEPEPERDEVFALGDDD